MKIFKLNGEVINIGEWDYKIKPVQNKEPRTEKQRGEMASNGQDYMLVYDDNGDVITEITNPLPDGAIEFDDNVVEREDGGFSVATDYAKLRVYPPIGDQLDAIFHAMDSGLLTMIPEFYDPIKNVKDKFPKS